MVSGSNNVSEGNDPWGGSYYSINVGRWNEMKGGQKRRSDRKFFPGYVLVEMEMNDETWHLVKDVPKVMGFIGGTKDRPAPITDKEVQCQIYV